MKGNKKIIVFLLSILFVICFSSPAYCSEVYDAASTNNYDRLNELLASGAEPIDTIYDEYGVSRDSLGTAAYNGYLDIVKLLISYGAYIEGNSNIGVTPLTWAVYGGYPEVVDYLINSGANVNARYIGANGGKENTILGTAAYYSYNDETKYLKIIEMLLNAGAEINDMNV